MKKYYAVISFYTTSDSEEDTGDLKRLVQFVRRLNLSVVIGQHDCTPYRLPYVSVFDREKNNELAAQCTGIYEHNLLMQPQMVNLKRFHALVSMLRSYADYCGIGNHIVQMGELSPDQKAL